MKLDSALIVYVGRTHSKHNEIINDLRLLKAEVSEYNMPASDIGTCSLTDQLNQSIQRIDLLIVYLSQETKKHACIVQAVELANKYGKKIVGIWLEDAKPDDLCEAVALYGDNITPYDHATKNIFCGEADTWLNPDYSNPPKTKTKKHTCG
ncbi:TIR domain-containing protein [Pseudomonas iridis]|uniref:TIR domain-containing protein n=1 Tax=Pseudomonas iridis TaxID=2710587 RepID=UPI0021BE80F6|nr:TIR domain-containing protein [Pseudomonas iridis]MCT8947818.1 TIR domain-containing protein [Pseudomonas iridis]